MRPRRLLLHLSGLFSLRRSELERRFPLEPGSSDWLTKSHTHKAKHRQRIHTMLGHNTAETEFILMANMSATSF